MLPTDFRSALPSSMVVKKRCFADIFSRIRFISLAVSTAPAEAVQGNRED
jgi:hypothetical protein